MIDGSSTDRVVAVLRRAAAVAPPGTPMPTTRSLMAAHDVGPNTVARAVSRLVSEGVLLTEPGRGTFSAARVVVPTGDTGWQTVALGEPRVDARDITRIAAPPEPDTLVLSAGYPSPDLQPLRALAAAAGRAARRPAAWALPPSAGLPELRQLMGRAVGADPDDVLVVPGGQAGLSTTMRALGSPGSAVLVEVPTYLGALAAARAAGLRPVPVPTDAEGIRADLLPAAFARSGARLLYLQPSFANPTGRVLAPSRRREVLEAATAAGAFVLEDDWARYLVLEGDPPPPLARDDPDGHVVHVSSLSKSSAPSLRVGAVVARGPAAARLAAVRITDDLGVARPLQEIAVELLGSPAWPRHQARLRRELRSRRDAMVALLHAAFPDLEPVAVPRGGFHLWQRLPDGIDDVELAARAWARGVVIGAGTPYFVCEPPAPYIRLSFAGAETAHLAAGVGILADLLRC